MIDEERRQQLLKFLLVGSFTQTLYRLARERNDPGMFASSREKINNMLKNMGMQEMTPEEWDLVTDFGLMVTNKGLE